MLESVLVQKGYKMGMEMLKSSLSRDPFLAMHAMCFEPSSRLPAGHLRPQNSELSDEKMSNFSQGVRRA